MGWCTSRIEREMALTSSVAPAKFLLSLRRRKSPAASSALSHVGRVWRRK
jgi:hypothetical protein